MPIADHGVPNPVVALKDGTMDGILQGLNQKGILCSQVVKRHNAQRKCAGMSSNVLEFNRSRFRNSGHFRINRRTFLFFWMFDLEEFESGHLADQVCTRSQLVQATDEYVGVRIHVWFLSMTQGFGPS